MTGISEALSTYLRLRGMKPSARFLRRRRLAPVTDENKPFAPGRDPHSIGDALDGLVRLQGWSQQLQREDVALNWETIAGQENAAHSHLEAFSGGVVVVRCDSTARATQMRIMRAQFLTRVIELYPDAQATDIRFIGPDVPSWSHGSRRVQGRGPRDTYG